MDVFVQAEYLTTLETQLAKHSLSSAVRLTAQLNNQTELAIFDSQHIPKNDQLNFCNEIILISAQDLNITTLNQLKPVYIIDEKKDFSMVAEYLKEKSQNKQTVFAKADIVPVDERSQIESLQKELEEKSESLKYFVNEENAKKQKEKKLLYFLDFLNAEHDTAEFIENLCELLWGDLKKVGSFHALGFIIRHVDSDNTFILFDGKSVKINSNIYFAADSDKPHAVQLADILQRPLAATRFWAVEKNAQKSFFFLENRGATANSETLDSYISERLDLMVSMLQRHISQLQTTYLLNKWNIFGKAYQQPMHVIDSDFNLIQSNYAENKSEKKCYVELAGKTEPCENCPVTAGKNTTPVMLKQKKYKSYATKFRTDKDYFFVFYESQVESDKIRSDLIQNEKMNVIGQLANHLAHELNNPLTGLKLATEFVLQQPQLEASVKSDFSEVLKGIDRCKNIITDLLEFSSDKDLALQIGTVDDVVKRTMPLLKSITRHLNVFVALKSIPVKLNHGHLQQIVFNLIKNAAQALPAKGSLKIYDMDTPTNYDVIFEDNGPGLPESIKSHLFEPFSTTKSSGEGTGLGLYISKSLIKRMNADLLHDASYKNGTRFILRFFK